MEIGEGGGGVGLGAGAPLSSERPSEEGLGDANRPAPPVLNVRVDYS